MAKIRAFISFDFDHDEKMKNLLAGQAKNPDSPFDFADWSIKEAMSADWEKKARIRIRGIDQMIVLCGESTHTATGVGKEVRIAKEERKPYFLLAAYSDKVCTKPTSASAEDKVYKWEWDILKRLLTGAR